MTNRRIRQLIRFWKQLKWTHQVTSQKATLGIIYSAAMTFASTSSLFEKKNAVYYFQISLYISRIFKTWSEFSNISQSMPTRYGCKHLHHTTELISWRSLMQPKICKERRLLGRKIWTTTASLIIISRKNVFCLAKRFSVHYCYLLQCTCVSEKKSYPSEGVCKLCAGREKK